MELTVGFHESLTCLTVCGQDRVCAAESIWTEGGKSSLEKTTTGQGCRTHIHFAWWTSTHWCILSSLLKWVLQLLWWRCSRSCGTTWQYEAQTGQKPHPGLSCAPSGFIKYSWSQVSGVIVSDTDKCLSSDSYHERKRIISVPESECEMTEANHKIIYWCTKIGCVHSIKMFKWWVKKKEIGQMLSHPVVTTEGLHMKHHFKGHETLEQH